MTYRHTDILSYTHILYQTIKVSNNTTNLIQMVSQRACLRDIDLDRHVDIPVDQVCNLQVIRLSGYQVVICYQRNNKHSGHEFDTSPTQGWGKVGARSWARSGQGPRKVGARLDKKQGSGKVWAGKVGARLGQGLGQGSGKVLACPDLAPTLRRRSIKLPNSA